MKVRLYSAFKEKEHRIIEAFAEGVRSVLTDTAEIVGTRLSPLDYDCDVAVVFGVKGKALFEAHRAAGQAVIMLDKAMIPGNRWEHVRVSVNAHQPTAYLMDVKRKSDRLSRLGVSLKPWRSDGDIVFAGSSEKYHRFHNLPHPTQYAATICGMIRFKDEKSKIIYRPKPTWRDAERVPNADYSGRNEDLAALLLKTRVLVTHGSGASVNAVIAGVPCVIFGEGVAAPISSRHIDDVIAPLKVSDDDRMQWLANLAYCQWTRDELRSGMAWHHTRIQVKKEIE